MMLSEAIHFIDNSLEPFSIKVVKYNEKNRSGGDFLVLKNCIKLQNLNKKGKTNAPQNAVYQKPPRAIDPNGIYKDPNHYKNATRNLVELQKVAFVNLDGKAPKKIHIWLITELNGHKIKM